MAFLDNKVCELFTISSLFKFKGGHFNTNLEGNIVRVEAKIGECKAEAKIGIDFKGMCSIEGKFEDVVGFKPSSCSPGEAGIGQRMVLTHGNGSIQAGLLALEEVVRSQGVEENKDGFFNSREKVVISLAQFNEGEDGDILLVKNERVKSRLSLRGGSWKGLEYHFDDSETLDEEIDPLVAFGLVFEEWKVTDFINVKVPFKTEQVAKNEEKGDISVVTGWSDFLEILDENVSTWAPAKRNLLFWQVEDLKVSAKKQRNLATIIFKRSNEWENFLEFVDNAIIRLDEWAPKRQRMEWGISEDRKFVIAQMGRCRAQLLTKRREGLVFYEPTPESYLESRK